MLAVSAGIKISPFVALQMDNDKILDDSIKKKKKTYAK